MGLSTIAAALSEDEGTVEDVLEPYLIANGYLERTAKGRKATKNTYDVLNIKFPKQDAEKISKSRGAAVWIWFPVGVGNSGFVWSGSLALKN